MGASAGSPQDVPPRNPLTPHPRPEDVGPGRPVPQEPGGPLNPPADDEIVEEDGIADDPSKLPPPPVDDISA